MLEDTQRTLESWQAKHREAASEARVLSDKARQATTLADEYQHDLEVARGQLEDEKRLVSSLQVLHFPCDPHNIGLLYSIRFYAQNAGNTMQTTSSSWTLP